MTKQDAIEDIMDLMIVVEATSVRGQHVNLVSIRLEVRRVLEDLIKSLHQKTA